MNQFHIKLGLVSVTLLLAAACNDPNALTGGRDPGAAEDEQPGDEQSAAQALECTVKPEGNSYELFDGTKLEATRVNENVGVNRARIKPYAVLAGEYQRVIGVVPESLKTAGPSFNDPPERWFAESVYSGVAMNAIFEISFEGCLARAKTEASLSAAPTAASAEAECTQLMRKAWSRSPSPEETSACTELAVTKLADQKDVARRWAYVCASVLSSSQFLTF